MYMNIIGAPTDQDMDTYPHVFLTSPHEWDPSVLDYGHPNDDGEPAWAPDPSIRDQHDPKFDEFGYYKDRTIANLEFLCDYPNSTEPSIDYTMKSHNLSPNKIDFTKLRPYFGWVNEDTIKKASATIKFPMQKHLKSRFPALSVPRRQEPVATDTLLSHTPAIGSAAKYAQIFVGKDTLVSDLYELKSQKQVVNTLEDNIRIQSR